MCPNAYMCAIVFLNKLLPPHPQAGEDPALTLAQCPTPVNWINRLNVENRPSEQLSYVSHHLHLSVHSRAVRRHQTLKHTTQMSVRMTEKLNSICMLVYLFRRKVQE